MRALSTLILSVSLFTSSLSYAGEIRIWDKSSAVFAKKSLGIFSDSKTPYMVLKVEGEKFTVQECTTRPSKVYKKGSLESDLNSSCSTMYRDSKFDSKKFFNEASSHADENLGKRKGRAVLKAGGAAVLGMGSALFGVLATLSVTGGITAPFAALFAPMAAGGSTITYISAKDAHYDYVTERKISQEQIADIMAAVEANPNSTVTLFVDDYKLFADSFEMLLDRI